MHAKDSCMKLKLFGIGSSTLYHGVWRIVMIIYVFNYFEEPYEHKVTGLKLSL
jgi:hypothetical protein